MKVMWCWRCQMEIPMLEDDEWEEMLPLHELRMRTGRIQPFLDAYERITGFKETNPNAIWHHRVSLFGPPCDECGKPLRTPKAKLCAACGWRVPK